MIVKPAKELSILLQTKVMLERPNTEYIQKQDGLNLKQFYMIGNSKNQFCCDFDNFDFNLTKDEVFARLATSIQNHGDRIRFCLLPMPTKAGIDHLTIDLTSDVIMRTIDYYEIRIDEILTRYDVLVEKVIKNV